MKKEKITFSQLTEMMREHNRKNHENAKKGMPEEKLEAVIVYKKSNWKKDYSVKSRSYKVTNSNRYFQDGKIANSLFGSCLDGTDNGVRLDWYWWDVEYCYFV